MNCKALYGGIWYKVQNVNFSTQHATLQDDDKKSLGTTIGNTLSVPINMLGDLKIN